MPKRTTEKLDNNNAVQTIDSIIFGIHNIMREDHGLNGDGQRLEQLSWLILLKLLDANETETELELDGYTSPIPEELRWRTWAEAPDKDRLTGDELIAFIDGQLFPALRHLRASEQNNPVARSIAHTLTTLFTDVNNYMKNGVVLAKVINQLNLVDFNSRTERHLFNDIYEQMLSELQSDGVSWIYTPRPITNFIVKTVNPQFGEVVLDPACGIGGFLVSTVDHLRSLQLTTEQELHLERYIRGIEWSSLPYTLCITNLLLHNLAKPHISKVDALSNYISKDTVHCIVTNPPFGISVNINSKNFTVAHKTNETDYIFLMLIIELLLNGGRAGIVLPDGSLSGEGVKARIRQKLLEECNLHTIVRLDNSVFKPYATVKTNLLFFTKGQPTKEVWYFQNPLPDGSKGYSKTKPMQDKDFDALRAWWHHRTENENAWRVPIADIAARGYDLDIKHPNTVEYLPKRKLKALLIQGESVWNSWRVNNPKTYIDLRDMDLGYEIINRAGNDSLDERPYLDEMNEPLIVNDGPNLNGVDLSNSMLQNAKFYGATLTGANFRESNIFNANFQGAYLEDVIFEKANLSHSNFSNANLTGANLKGAELTGAALINTNLTNAILDGARIYGISAWDIKISGASQKDLIITPEGEPEITVDDLEIAQFIYLLLNNGKFRNVIETITSKAVLILGRFTEERKQVLDAIRDELRKRNFLPILFDFEKPATRDLTETISILAKLSRFVIADLSDPKSIPHELNSIIKDTPNLPVKPIILQGQKEYAMFEHLRSYPWVLPIYEYQDERQLIATLSEEVIEPVERKVQEIRGT